jgi:xanthine dehydrogenase molybdenum-binding subunit
MAAATSQDFKVIGTRPVRHDGVDKVTGRAKYGADYSFPGMLHGKVLRSPYAHARIKSIDIDKALALPGVRAIIIGNELPELPNRMEAVGEIPFNPHDCSYNVLARDRVLYHGHAIAAVAATSPHVAEEALALITVEYEPLPSVTGVEEAMAPDAPILHPQMRTPESGDEPTNVASHVQFKRGDLDAGFKAADYIVEREFKTAMVHQGYIEPHNAVGIYNSDGRVTIYCSTQAPFELRAMSAMVLGIAVGDVKVVPTEIGGGFGGKCVPYLEPLAVLLSKKNPDTGKIEILRCTVAQDAGKAIHPSYVKGQMQGGTAQGIGWALNEEYIYDDQGVMRNAGFLDYRMPTCLDLPLIETCVVEVPNPAHPLGIRGVGEVSIVPPPAAVANALYRAAGIRMTQTPMSPPRVLKAILSKGK